MSALQLLCVAAASCCRVAQLNQDAAAATAIALPTY